MGPVGPNQLFHGAQADVCWTDNGGRAVADNGRLADGRNTETLIVTHDPVLIATTFNLFRQGVQNMNSVAELTEKGTFRQKNAGKFDVSPTRIQWKTSQTRIRPKVNKK